MSVKSTILKKIILLLLCSLCFSTTAFAATKGIPPAAAKLKVALIDFTDATPEKIAITFGDDAFDKLNLPEIMTIIRSVVASADIYDIIPYSTILSAMNTQLGKEAIARKYDAFSAARLGKSLSADALLVGEVLNFEKNLIPGNFVVNGIDVSNRQDDVMLRVKLISAKDGKILADIICGGTANENVVQTVSASMAYKLSTGFLEATKISALKAVRELKSADIKPVEENTPPVSEAASSDITIKQIGKNGIYMNAGRAQGVSVADMFTIFKKNKEGNFISVAICRVSAVGADSSRLELVRPEGGVKLISVGNKAERMTSNTQLESEKKKTEEAPKKKGKKNSG